MPPLEVEAKFYIADLAGLEARLQAARARLIQPRSYEYNLRLDTSGEDMRKARQVLRLRQDEAGTRLTFKGPNESNAGVVKRLELEVQVGDLDTARELLQALGFQIVAVYEKYRTTYEHDGLLWMLDELPIGSFLEIEGKDGAAIHAAAQELGLDWEKRISTGYLDLFTQLKQVNGWNFRDLTFTNFVGLELLPGSFPLPPADR